MNTTKTVCSPTGFVSQTGSLPSAQCVADSHVVHERRLERDTVAAVQRADHFDRMALRIQWKTLPVSIFGLTDRGQAFQAAAGTTVLLLVTLLVLIVLGRICGLAALR